MSTNCIRCVVNKRTGGDCPCCNKPEVGKEFTTEENGQVFLWVPIESDNGIGQIPSGCKVFSHPRIKESLCLSEAFDYGAISYGAVNPVNGCAVMIEHEVMWVENNGWKSRLHMTAFKSPDFFYPLYSTHVIFEEEEP